MSLEASTGVSRQKKLDQNQWAEIVRRKVDSLKFGVVQITVHDSRVVQIERTEKVRLDRPADDEGIDTGGGEA